MQGVTIASASTCAPILSTRLAFHSQTLTQQALEALSITKDPVVWLPLLQKPVSGTNAVGGSRTADSDSDDSSEGEADLENVELTHSVWGGQPRRQKARDYQGAAACAVRRGDLLYVIPVARDVEPLLPFAFVDALDGLLTDYFGTLSEAVIKDNFDVILQILEEVLAPPHPVLTDASSMKELIPPSTLFTKMLGAASAALSPSAHQSAPSMLEARHTLSSPIPWRRQGIKYQNQECFFDISEQLSAVIDRNGQLVTADVWGRIEAKCRLSAMPDLTMVLTSPDLLQDCCFHPCVRLARWAQSKVLSFVPPDGRFTLMEYRLAKPTSATVVPLKVKPSITVGSMGGSFQLHITSMQPSDRPLENVRLSFDLGKHAGNIQATLTGGRPNFSSKSSRDPLASLKTPELESSTGRWEFLPEKGTLIWQSPRLSSAEAPVLLQGTWQSSLSPCPRPSMAISASFQAPLTNVSGIQVSSLKIASGAGEGATPFKGVRPMMSSKSVDFRW